MRPVIIKAYGAIDPATTETLADVQAVLDSWFINDAVALERDMLKISFEGDVFPDEDVVSALRPYLTARSKGRLDILDLEEWTLRRWIFSGMDVKVNTVTLNKALDTSLL